MSETEATRTEAATAGKGGEASRPLILVVLIAGVISISFAAIFIRYAQAEGVPALSIAALRLTMAAVALTPYAWAAQRREILATSRREMLLMVAAGTFLALHFATWIASLEYTSVASSVVLVTVNPLFVGPGSWLLLGERPGMQMVAGIILATVGSVIVGWGDFGAGSQQLLGDLLALAGAAMMASYLMIGRSARGRRSLTAYIAPVYGVAAVVLLALALLAGQPLLGFSFGAYAWIAAMALVPQLIGHSSLNWALRHLTATYVSIAILAEPVGSSILAYFLLGEKITPTTAIGGSVILAGIYIASQAELRSRRRKPGR